ncbi:histidine phosphatase family protein [Paenibacillus thermotolerans]|uniref:histidine phosphatase family protein n=1 Tax=Paenibacillus thermotolerans TaxID=3027807 RepID=UPI00236850BA|nr:MULTISPECIES: histidine phosphatase family protein [unclassified Paenibacillus]
MYFIRHAQGEHTVDWPRSLETIHPSLTALGRQQAGALRSKMMPKESDLVVASPTMRTLETAEILAAGSGAPIYVTPLVGPRMFPPVTDEEGLATLLCDYILSAKAVKRKFPQAVILYEHYKGLSNEGLNRMDSQRYGEAVGTLLEWIRMQRSERVFIVSHDGTITDYRQRLTGRLLTRDDFLGDAGYIKLEMD